MKIRRVVLLVSVFVLCSTAAYCMTVVIPRAHAQAVSCNTPAEKTACQAQYDQLQQEIAQYQKVIDDTRAKAKSLQGDVTQLDAQIKKAQAEINQRTITINTLTSQISQKTKNIQTLEQRLDLGHASLAKMLREKNELDTTSLAVLALSRESLSDFLSDADAINTLNQDLQDLFDQLRGVKEQTEAEKQALAAQQDKQLDAKHDAQVLQQAVNTAKQSKTAELTVTKGQESAYNLVLAQKQAQATQIRNALFNLRDTSAITFESALQYATVAQQKTGVRAALILGILRQESNLGANVGQCYLTDDTTGTGIKKSTGATVKNVMNPTRDVPPFLALMSRLGIEPHTQVVSCPLAVGYGGAMGPTQFIASTWVPLEPRIAKLTGAASANPWNAQDAITATALYLADRGAGLQTYSAERKAAAQYYAGGNWQTSGALAYAASVLSYADQYQQNIDFLNNL